MSTTSDCSSTFVVFEFVIANIPMLLFLLLGYINFRRVKGSGFNRIVHYSVFFQCKLVICVLAALINLCIVVVAMIDPEMIDASGDYGTCLQKIAPAVFGDPQKNVRFFIGASRIMGIVAWVVSYKLLVYLYRKGLSEFWYAHKMFWLLNALLTCINTIWQGSSDTFHSDFMMGCKVVLICLNVSLLALMIRTKARTQEQPRPGIRVTSEGHIFVDPAGGTRRTTSYGNMRFQPFPKSSSHYGRQSSTVREPLIDVNIMQRTKEHPSDDFKIHVNYKLMLSKEE